MMYSRMKHAATAIGLMMVSTSCTGHDTTPTTTGQRLTEPQLVPGRLLSWTPVSNVGDAGGLVTQAPTVRVFDSAGFTPISGVLVRFTIAGGGGAILRDTVTSDRDGFASVGWWRLGTTPGVDTLVASVSGLPPVRFTARLRVVIATYDLQAIAGHALPVTYPGVTVTGAHYVLFDDGSCKFGYDGTSNSGSALTYVQRDSTTILFYLLPGTYPNSSFYADRNGLFSTGKLNGNTMTVNYEDIFDFDNPEVYVRHASVGESAQWPARAP
jgi:hypothetical protein